VKYFHARADGLRLDCRVVGILADAVSLNAARQVISSVGVKPHSSVGPRPLTKFMTFY